MTKVNKNAAVIYQGPSQIDGAPIVVIVTGLAKASQNEKTGDMVQTYILRADMVPTVAVKVGADSSICGACIHRGKPNPDQSAGAAAMVERSCYVTVMHGPRSAYAGWVAGSTKAQPVEVIADRIAGRMVRLGTYGDPAAVPLSVWEILLSKAQGWTGYSHQWRNLSGDWARLVMASADSVEDVTAAHALGFRTFRVAPAAGQEIRKVESVCPASAEKGKVTDCATCRACMGTSGKARASIVIAAHGAGAKHARGRAA